MSYLGVTTPLRRLAGWLAARAHPARLRPAPARVPLVVGHRGAAMFAAENTVAAFDKAMDLGANAVEADVSVTKDGHAVLWHDADPGTPKAFARRHGAEKMAYLPTIPDFTSPLCCPVRDLTLEQLRANFGYRPRHSHGDEKPIPLELLDDLLGWAEREPRVESVFLDLKIAPVQAHAAVALYGALADARRSELRSRVALNLLTPQREVAAALVAESRRLPAEGLHVVGDFEFPGVLRDARTLGLRRVSLGETRRLWPEFRDELVRLVNARTRGELEAIAVWTIDDRDRIAELVAIGVDAILTDEPSRMRRLLEPVPDTIAADPADAGSTPRRKESIR